MNVRQNGRLLASGLPRIAVAADGEITYTVGSCAVSIGKGELAVLKPAFLAYCDEIAKSLELARLAQPAQPS